MYLPNDWYEEFEDYKRDEFRGNEGIYDNFTIGQFEAIKGYFRWRTKTRFKELVANTSLAVKPKKAETLAQIMGNVTDWVYDGCVDTGFLGASHCELGHALRYEHYAASPSTGREIIFGVNCASDFFGIDPENLRKINTVQDEILEEVKLVAFIINTDKQAEFQKRFYGDLMSIINVLRSELNEAFGYGWNHQMADFLKAGLPLTKSMVWKVEQVRNGIYTKRLRERGTDESIATLANNDPKAIEYIKSGANKNIYIVKLIMDSLQDQYDNTDKTEVRKRQALVRLAMQFNETYNKLNGMGVADFTKFVNSVKEEVYYTKTASGERLATKKEISEKVPQLITKEEHYLPEEQYKMMRLFGWGIFGENKMYLDSGCPDADTSMERVTKSGRMMAATLTWLNDIEEFKKSMVFMATAKGKVASRVYPDKAEDEIKVEQSMEEIIPFICEHCPKDSGDRTLEIALDIANKATQYENYSVSVKQANMLRKAYSMLTGEATIKEPTNSSNTEPDVFGKIEILQKNQNNPALAKHDFAFKVMGTILRYRRASEKQEKIINDAYDALIKSQDNNKSSSNANIIFVEDDNNGKNNRNDTTEQDDSSVFVEGSKQGNKSSKGFWKTSADALIKMPTITEISQALGAGVIKGEDNNGQ